MYAMILAAGFGRRMMPLTKDMPKPLVEVHKKPLIIYHIEALREAGVTKLVINTGVMGEMIRDRVGDGSHYDLTIIYSTEGNAPLDTAGGIVKALPYLGAQPFIVVNADVYTDFEYRVLCGKALETKAHIVLVDKPEYLDGDFGLDDGLVHQANKNLVYAGIGLYHPEFFSYCPQKRYPLAPLLRDMADRRLLSGVHFLGLWHDVGTSERLQQINRKMV